MELRLAHGGIVDRSTYMSVSGDFTVVIDDDIKSASEIRDRGLWDRISGWKHLFSSAKDMIVRGAKPYYKYRVSFTIDSGYKGTSQNDLIRNLGNFRYSDEGIWTRSLIIETIKKELAFEGLNVEVSINSMPLGGGGKAFGSDITITDLDYVYNPDLIR